jgi:hypothetical protein
MLHICPLLKGLPYISDFKARSFDARFKAMRRFLPASTLEAPF